MAKDENGLNMAPYTASAEADDEVIDLLEVVKPGRSMKKTSDEDEDFSADLESMLDTLSKAEQAKAAEEAGGQPFPDPTPVDHEVDPDESLDMPSMDDLDDILHSLGAPATPSLADDADDDDFPDLPDLDAAMPDLDAVPVAKKAVAAVSPPSADDELLSGLGLDEIIGEAGAPPPPASLETPMDLEGLPLGMEDASARQDPAEDDLFADLDGLVEEPAGSPPGDAQLPAEDDLFADLDGLTDAPAGPPAGNTQLPAEDDLFADLDGLAEDPAGPPPGDAQLPAEDDLFADLDGLTDAPAGPPAVNAQRPAEDDLFADLDGLVEDPGPSPDEAQLPAEDDLFANLDDLPDAPAGAVPEADAAARSEPDDDLSAPEAGTPEQGGPVPDMDALIADLPGAAAAPEPEAGLDAPAPAEPDAATAGDVPLEPLLTDFEDDFTPDLDALAALPDFDPSEQNEPAGTEPAEASGTGTTDVSRSAVPPPLLSDEDTPPAALDTAVGDIASESLDLEPEPVPETPPATESADSGLDAPAARDFGDSVEDAEILMEQIDMPMEDLQDDTASATKQPARVPEITAEDVLPATAEAEPESPSSSPRFDEVDLNELDALLDDMLASAPASGPAPAGPSGPVPGEEAAGAPPPPMEEPADASLAAPAVQNAESEALGVELAALRQDVESLQQELGAVRSIAQTPPSPPAGLDARIEDLDLTLQNLDSRMQSMEYQLNELYTNIDKFAAEAAAKIIREELAALLQAGI